MPAIGIVREIASRTNSAVLNKDCGSFDAKNFDKELKEDARSKRPGILFLDNLEELCPRLQVELCTALPTAAGDATRSRRRRVIAAAAPDLDARAKCGEFRSELCWRLWNDQLIVPPLRELKAHFPAIVESVLAEARILPCSYHLAFDDEARMVLERYSWPGNCHELRSVILGSRVNARKRGSDRIEVRDLALNDRRVSLATEPSFRYTSDEQVRAAFAATASASRCHGADESELDGLTAEPLGSKAHASPATAGHLDRAGFSTGASPAATGHLDSAGFSTRSNEGLSLTARPLGLSARAAGQSNQRGSVVRPRGRRRKDLLGSEDVLFADGTPREKQIEKSGVSSATYYRRLRERRRGSG